MIRLIEEKNLFCGSKIRNTRDESERRRTREYKVATAFISIQIMQDALDKVIFYQKALLLWSLFWEDSEILMNDVRGKELAKQLVRSVDSISANIEEGYGRGFGKEYPHFLRISRGSARESKGRYKRCSNLLSEATIEQRINLLNEIIAMETKTIETLENKNKIK